LSLLSDLWRDLGTREGRYFLVEWVFRDAPGRFGSALRVLVLRRFFQRAGRGLRLPPGIRLIGVHHLSVGDNCTIGLENVIQATGGVEMGDNVLLGPGVKIWSVNHIFARTDLPIVEQGYEHKKVVIGNGVWIGAQSFIMPGAKIGDGVVVSAGSVVGGKDIEPYAIVAGNPARKIGSRMDRAAIAEGTLGA
jgi:acetyltransferase-like isoleucine patch superfamily enzyme